MSDNQAAQAMDIETGLGGAAEEIALAQTAVDGEALPGKGVLHNGSVPLAAAGQHMQFQTTHINLLKRADHGTSSPAPAARRPRGVLMEDAAKLV